LPKKTGLGSGPYQLSLVCVEFEATGGHPLANLGNTQFQLSVLFQCVVQSVSNSLPPGGGPVG